MPERYVVYDLETTSLNPETAEICQMAFVDLDGEVLLSQLVYPSEPIEPGATAVHGITEEMVAGVTGFGEAAYEVQQIVQGAILCGYNSRRFDAIILDRELRGAGQPGLVWETVREIDAHQVWICREPRTLAGALRMFCDEEFEDAHDALADARAAAKVIRTMGDRWFGEEGDPFGQLEAASKPVREIDRLGRYRLEDGVRFCFGRHRGKLVRDHLDYIRWLGTQDGGVPPEALAAVALELEITPAQLEELIATARPPWAIDIDGKFRRCEDTGRARIEFGKHKGEYAAHHPRYLRWMLGADFSEETKSHIRGWLGQMAGAP